MTTGTHTPPALPAADERFLTELARQLRADSIQCSTAAGSGHPISAMSAADLMAVLLARHLRYDWDNPGKVGNDHLIFSKGHASRCCTPCSRRPERSLGQGLAALWGGDRAGRAAPGQAALPGVGAVRRQRDG